MILGSVAGRWRDHSAPVLPGAQAAPRGTGGPGRPADGSLPLIAVDSVGAGVGERVLVLDEGNGARQVLASADGPVQSVIVGIVDDVQG